MSRKVLIFASFLPWLLFTGCASLSPSGRTAADLDGRVRLQRTNDVVRVEIDGALFTEYHYKNVPRPLLYPLIGPDRLPMTRNWPMKNVPGEEHDHPHHRSLWYTHGDVNGVDFWSEQPNAGRIVHAEFVRMKSGQGGAELVTRNRWETKEGKVICTDERTHRFYNTATGRLFDFEITIYASHGELTFGDTKEGTMAVRVAETMRVKGPHGQGHIVNSTGVSDGETWGKRATWCDYSGPVNGKVVGIAIFDHPDNPRHPTWWHVRDYGLFAANPFGKHDFEKLADKTAGNLKVPVGQSVTFRYRFYLHEGDAAQANVASRYRDYVSAYRKSAK